MSIFSFFFGKSQSGAGPQTTVETPSAARSSNPRASVQWRDGSFPMQAVVESHYQDSLIAICGTYSRDGKEARYEGLIEREPANPHDPNAIMVKILGRKVGYLPREQAERVSEQMRGVGLSSATCSVRVRGGWRTNQHDEGCYGVQVAIPNHGRIDFGIGAEPRTR